MIYSICFPNWSAEAGSTVQAFRREHDPQFPVLAPHFTLVFGARVDDERFYIDHVSRVATSSEPIQFALRHAVPYFLGRGPAHVLLVPDEGLSLLARLHDALYTGLLAPHLRLDMPFLPHLTIASSNDPRQAHAWCRAWNGRGLVIEGSVNALTIGRLRAGRLETIATLRLGSA